MARAGVVARQGHRCRTHAAADRPDGQFLAYTAQADALARNVARQKLGAEFASRITRNLATLDGEFVETAAMPRELLFWRAQRLVIALERLSDFVNRTRQDAPRSAELADLRQDLRWSVEFDVARFAGRPRAYRLSLGGAAR